LLNVLLQLANKKMGFKTNKKMFKKLLLEKATATLHGFCKNGSNRIVHNAGTLRYIPDLVADVQEVWQT
jgi:hypothetical protein